jgi:outer membrane protein W
MNKSTKKMLVLALSMLGAAQAHAFEARWDVGVGYDMGGENIGQATYTNGDTNTVRANQGMVMSVGGSFVNDEQKQFETLVNMAFKVGGESDGDGNKLEWKSFPITVVQFYRPGDFRVGLGGTYATNTKYTFRLGGRAADYKFDDGLGLVAQVGYIPPGTKISLDLRYTSIKHKFSNGGGSVDGSVAGLYASFRF